MMKCPDCDKENNMVYSMALQMPPPNIIMAGYECECGTKWKVMDGRISVDRPLKLYHGACFDGEIDSVSIAEVSDDD